jgi:hypothetical protein
MRPLAVFLGVLAIVLAFNIPVHAQGYGYGYGMGPGMMGGYGGYGGYGMGPGMMGGYGYGPGMGGYGGYGMGPGMMGGYGYGGGYGPGAGYGPHPQSQACHTFLNETQGLRKDLVEKRFEYSEAMRNPKMTTEDLAALQKQIDALQEKIQAKNTQGCWW